MTSHAPTAEQEAAHSRTVRSAGRRRPAAAPVAREVLRSEVADDVSRFLAEGNSITLVPIGASAFHPAAGRRHPNPWPAMEWDD